MNKNLSFEEIVSMIRNDYYSHRDKNGMLPIPGEEYGVYEDDKYKYAVWHDEIAITSKISGNEITYSKKNGFVATKYGEKIYSINPEGIATVYYNGGNDYSVLKDKINFDTLDRMISDNSKMVSNYNEEFTISRNELTVYKDDGSISYTQHFNDDGSSYMDLSTGARNYITKDKYYYRTDLPDGTILYDGLHLNPDGTFLNTVDNISGTYKFNDDGSIKCIDKDNISIYNQYGNIIKSIDANNNEYFYNDNGQIIKCIHKDGTVTEYNENGAEIKVSNGKITVSKINHIEYDEDEYNRMLKQLNDVDGSHINNNCLNIEDLISGFPDKYSGASFSEAGNNINNHFNLIKSLSSMVNYSLLAYQTCDEELRNGMELLIDSLFDENNNDLANNFKNVLKDNIEDRDNDGILEYKVDTNFYSLSENAIVSSIYEDDKGNKWYLNKNNKVLKVEGDNINITYGNETFNVTYDNNGLIILKDSNGNSLDIFGNYNLESEQFGGNQSDMRKVGADVYIDKIFNKYASNLPAEEKYQLLNSIASSGCGKVAVTNLVFRKFQGREKEFFDTFGFPMYDIKKTGNYFSVDYNYEPLILDLACHDGNVKYTDGTLYAISDYWILGVKDDSFGTSVNSRANMEKYLEESYNVKLENYNSPLAFVGEAGYTLYPLDGSSPVHFGPQTGKHAMIEVGKTDDGKAIVSSWGKAYIFEQSTDQDDIEFSSRFRKEYN